MSYQDVITMEPGKRGGKPCVRGLRVTVYEVLDYLASGMTPEQIVKRSLEIAGDLCIYTNQNHTIETLA